MIEEIILSVIINGHGCEDLTRPWSADTEVSQFFRNNVRVYSLACVPDIPSVISRDNNALIMKKISNQFDLSNKETKEVLDIFKEGYRSSYIEYVNAVEKTQPTNPILKNPKFIKAKLPMYLERSSNLITYLSNKTYAFEADPTSYVVNGISVCDIRIKQTDENGIVTYRQIILPKHDFTMPNLIYKEGVETILEYFQNQMGISHDLESIYTILGFNDEEERLQTITLNTLFRFFKELNISYVNIFDLTCRTCERGNLDPNEIERIFFYETDFNEKPVAFGKTNKKKLKKRTNKKRLQKRTNKKRTRVKRPLKRLK